MNVANNKKKQVTISKIEKAFIELIQIKDISEISVMDLVKKANINRSTFYTNYFNIYDLADKISEKMYQNILKFYKNEITKKDFPYNYYELFRHIKNNQPYYKTLFNLNFDFMNYSNNHLKKNIKNYKSDYHIEFFKSGMKAVIKKWLFTGCEETPEEMIEILKFEYKRKKLEF